MFRAARERAGLRASPERRGIVNRLTVKEELRFFNQDPALTSLFTPLTTNVPQFFVDLDRVKAQMLNVPTEGLSNLLGRTFQVTAQADSRFRLDPEDLATLKVRSTDGAMVRSARS